MSTSKPWPVLLYFLLIYAFEQCWKILPIMLNSMFLTTVVMPQFLNDFIIFNDYISIVIHQINFTYFYDAVLLFLT